MTAVTDHTSLAPREARPTHAALPPRRRSASATLPPLVRCNPPQSVPTDAAASAEGNQIFVVVRRGKEYPPKVCDCRWAKLGERSCCR